MAAAIFHPIHFVLQPLLAKLAPANHNLSYQINLIDSERPADLRHRDCGLIFVFSSKVKQPK